jgi:hypothetical protein
MLALAALNSGAALILTGCGKHFAHIFWREPNEYLKIFLQSLLGLAVIFLPDLLKKRVGLSITDGTQVIFALFLWAAIILGEVHSFYYNVPGWDTILHTLSGAMLGAFGFAFVDIVNRHNTRYMNLSPVFLAITAFCFAVTLDTLWEIIEFVMDLLWDLNMQQYITYAGEVIVGKAAVFDTMKDLVVDVAGALASSLIGYWSLMLDKRHTTAR